jgi:hypothetical protein
MSAELEMYLDRVRKENDVLRAALEWALSESGRRVYTMNGFEEFLEVLKKRIDL